jgi:hypothetical protein
VPRIKNGVPLSAYLVHRFQNINMLGSVFVVYARSGRRLGIWIGGIHGGTTSSDYAGQ